MFSIARDWKTPANRLKAAASRGRPQGLLRGSWIADLAALGKAVTLCGQCMPRWDARKNGYEQRNVTPNHRFATGECDGCGATHVTCAMYLPKEKR